VNARNQRTAEFELFHQQTWAELHRSCFQEILCERSGHQVHISRAYLWYCGWCSDRKLWHSLASFVNALRTAGYRVWHGVIMDTALVFEPLIYCRPMKNDLTIADVRRLYGISPGVLAALRGCGSGAPYKKLATGIYYPQDLFRDWLRRTTALHAEPRRLEIQKLLRRCLAELCKFSVIEVWRARRTGRLHPKLVHRYKYGRVAWRELLSAVEDWFDCEIEDVPPDLPEELRSMLRALGCRDTRIRQKGKRIPYVSGLWLKR